MDSIILTVHNKRPDFSEEEYKEIVLSIAQKLLYLYKEIIRTTDINDSIADYIVIDGFLSQTSTGAIFQIFQVQPILFL